MSEIDVLGTGKKVKCKYFSNTFSGGISISYSNVSLLVSNREGVRPSSFVLDR